tara:strand:- start:399 stop:659 length:261 start_codon:yes stop_codon:yes gene_type:complete
MISKTKYDLDKLTTTLNSVERELKTIDEDEKIKKYGTFFDSKYEVLQLYVLFMFFGVHRDIINQLPDLNKRGVYENDVFLTFPDID